MAGTLSAERLEYILTYSKRDDMSSDPKVVAEVTNTALAAMEYLDNAGIPERQSALYDLALASLTTHWLDNRDAISAGTFSQTPIGLRGVINQMKLIPPSVPESGTEA